MAQSPDVAETTTQYLDGQATIDELKSETPAKITPRIDDVAQSYLTTALTIARLALRLTGITEETYRYWAVVVGTLSRDTKFRSDFVYAMKSRGPLPAGSPELREFVASAWKIAADKSPNKNILTDLNRFGFFGMFNGITAASVSCGLNLPGTTGESQDFAIASCAYGLITLISVAGHFTGAVGTLANWGSGSFRDALDKMGTEINPRGLTASTFSLAFADLQQRKNIAKHKLVQLAVTNTINGTFSSAADVRAVIEGTGLDASGVTDAEIKPLADAVNGHANTYTDADLGRTVQGNDIELLNSEESERSSSYDFLRSSVEGDSFDSSLFDKNVATVYDGSSYDSTAVGEQSREIRNTMDYDASGVQLSSDQRSATLEDSLTQSTTNSLNDRGALAHSSVIVSTAIPENVEALARADAVAQAWPDVADKVTESPGRITRLQIGGVNVSLMTAADIVGALSRSGSPLLRSPRATGRCSRPRSTSPSASASASSTSSVPCWRRSRSRTCCRCSSSCSFSH
jgi:hypothetical protein